jgi:TPR repeat protein
LDKTQTFCFQFPTQQDETISYKPKVKKNTVVQLQIHRMSKSPATPTPPATRNANEVMPEKSLSRMCSSNSKIFDSVGFPMNIIKSAAAGGTDSNGGLNVSDIKAILKANGKSISGPSKTLRLRLKKLISDGASSADDSVTSPPLSCEYCGSLQSDQQKLKRCKCRTTYYCSSKCQKSHWKQHQKKHRLLIEVGEEKGKKIGEDQNKYNAGSTSTSHDGKKETTIEPPQPPENQVERQQNVRVRLTGLSNMALNGKLGTTTTWNEEKERFKVILDDKDIKKKGYVNVRPKNIEVIQEMTSKEMTHQYQEEEDRCCICLEELQSDASKFTMVACCGKGYHHKCFKNMLNSKMTVEQKMRCVHCQQKYKIIDEERVEELLFWVQKGKAWAQSMFGSWCKNGFIVQQSYEKAMEYYTLAADQGYAEAQYSLGLAYWHGKGVKQSYEKAIEYFTIAAEQKHSSAQCILASGYYKGFGVQQSYEKALEYYTLAAEQEDADAQYNMGVLYYHGKGVEQSDEIAWKWWTKAANQGEEKASKILNSSYENMAERGHIGAQLNLAKRYYNGFGVRQSFDKAAKYLKMAAERGNAFAQHDLGSMYEEGQGVPQSYEKAIEYYTLSAEQGQVRVQHKLGCLYANGTGVERSFKIARKWLTKAANKGYKPAIESLKLMTQFEGTLNATRAQEIDKENMKDEPMTSATDLQKLVQEILFDFESMQEL